MAAGFAAFVGAAGLAAGLAATGFGAGLTVVFFTGAEAFGGLRAGALGAACLRAGAALAAARLFTTGLEAGRADLLTDLPPALLARRTDEEADLAFALDTSFRPLIGTSIGCKGGHRSAALSRPSYLERLRQPCRRCNLYNTELAGRQGGTSVGSSAAIISAHSRRLRPLSACPRRSPANIRRSAANMGAEKETAPNR